MLLEVEMANLCPDYASICMQADLEKMDGDNAATVDMDRHSRKDQLIIRVADHGKGILEKIDRFLPPFTRLDIARGQANGSGLGLTIVSRMIKQHSGKLRVSNRKGGGFPTQIECQLKT